MALTAADESYSVSHSCFGTGFTAPHSERRDHTRVSLGRDRSREESRLYGSHRIWWSRTKGRKMKRWLIQEEANLTLTPFRERGALNLLALYPWHAKPGHPLKWAQTTRHPEKKLSQVNKMRMSDVYLHSQICFTIVFLTYPDIGEKKTICGQTKTKHSPSESKDVAVKGHQRSL